MPISCCEPSCPEVGVNERSSSDKHLVKGPDSESSGKEGVSQGDEGVEEVAQEEGLEGEAETSGQEEVEAGAEKAGGEEGEGEEEEANGGEDEEELGDLGREAVEGSEQGF